MLRLYWYLLLTIMTMIVVIWRFTDTPSEPFSWFVFIINLIALPYWISKSIESAKMLKITSKEG